VHTQRNSPVGSMRRGQRTFWPDNMRRTDILVVVAVLRKERGKQVSCVVFVADRDRIGGRSCPRLNRKDNCRQVRGQCLHSVGHIRHYSPHMLLQTRANMPRYHSHDTHMRRPIQIDVKIMMPPAVSKKCTVTLEHAARATRWALPRFLILYMTMMMRR